MTKAVPEWADTTAISQILGKTVRRVQQLTQEGVIETEFPPGSRQRKYRTTQTVQRYIAHVEQKATENGENSKHAELTLKKLEAEIALKESQGTLHKLKTAIAEGRYIPSEQAETELKDFMNTFRKFALTMTTRAAGALSAHASALEIRAAEKAMKKEIESMLSVFVDAMDIDGGTEAGE
jgi:phage terminase Nu1 subunit (DNA packaging protein)